MDHSPLIIAGGGLVGLAAAIMFSDRFERIDIFEKREEPIFPPSMQARSLQLVISARGWRTLEAIGMADDVLSHSLKLNGRMRHHAGGAEIEPYSVHGHEINCISRNTLYQLLTKRAEKLPNVHIHYDSVVQDVFLEKNAIDVIHYGHKKYWKYDLLIGADGVRSKVTYHLNRKGTVSHQLEKNHYREIRIQENLWERNKFHYWHSPKAMIGAFPVHEGGFSLFLVHQNEHMHELLVQKDQREFEALFPGVLEVVPEIREQLKHSKGGFLGSVHAENWHYSNRVVIMGDAAHAMLPFMGQGLNTGLEDLWNLNHIIDNKGNTTPELIESFTSNRKTQAGAIRRISENQFRYLTGKFTARDYAVKHLADHHLVKNDLPTTYMGCAFSLDPFAEILEREERLCASFTETEIEEELSRMAMH
jgi:kynurenine 3-monooxygenase